MKWGKAPRYHWAIFGGALLLAFAIIGLLIFFVYALASGAS
jgi:hypothetical protein